MRETPMVVAAVTYNVSDVLEVRSHNLVADGRIGVP